MKTAASIPVYNRIALYIRDTYKNKNTIHVFISWIIFSVLFLYAAYNKPFHADEFFSWVYSERCSFADILLLRDFGIGHAPLYHIIQKIIQTIFQNYNPIQVRLANFLIGSLFIILLSSFLLKHRKIPLLCYAICASASILDIFLFSRMYGLVCLSSLLLLRFGERYCENPKRKYLIYMALSCFLGFFSDYNFILLVPYVVLVVCSNKSYEKKALISLIVFSTLIWVASVAVSTIIKHQSVTMYFSTMLSDASLMIYQVGKILFNFWFKEIFLLALLFFGFFFFLTERKRLLQPFKNTRSTVIQIAIFFMVLALLCFFVVFGYLRIRYAIIIISLIVALKYAGEISSYKLDPVKIRMLFSVIAGILILLAVNPYFWRDLRSSRFINIFMPYLLFFIIKVFNKRLLIAFGALSIVSGALYLQSFGLAGMYPPPAVDGDTTVIFQDVMAYSTQYLKKDHGSKVPIILDFKPFRVCRVCRMGTNDVDFERYEKIVVVGRDDFDIKNAIPGEFQLIAKNDYFSPLDTMLVKYLTPLFDWRYSIYELGKSE